MFPGKIKKGKKPVFREGRWSSFWSDVWESVSGSDKDFTEVRMSKAILLLSIPMVLEMVMESVFAVVDILFVSRLGPDAVAAVGITESVNTIVYAIGMGLSLATTSMVSRRIGEKHPEEASKTAFQAILVASAVALAIGIPGAIYSKQILSLMGASDNIVRNLSGYTTIMFGTNIVIMLLFIINAVFRSSGDAAVAMKVLWIGNIINIILDPCLIFGWGPFPEMGITGAAVATTIGRGTAVAYQFYLLLWGNKRVKIALRHMVVDLKTMGKLVSLSLGGIGQNLIATTSWIGLVRIISVFGSEVLAGYTIAIRIILFVLLPSWGVSNAASTLVGQNLGAGKPDRAETAVWFTGKLNFILLGTISLVLVTFPHFFIGLFISEPEVVKYGASGLRIISYGFAAYGFGMVLINSFNGSGDTTTPVKINFVVFWLIEIPLAWFLAIALGFRETGVFIAIVISESLLTLIAWLIFRRGRWKQNVV